MTLGMCTDQKERLPELQTIGKLPHTSPYYDYDPIPNGWIRLLQIHDDGYRANDPEDSGSDFSTAICITLINYPLSDCPDFTALSYTWGSPTPDPDPKYATFTAVPRCFPITCEGKLLRATHNLRDALRRIREAQARRKLLERQGVNVRDMASMPGAWDSMEWCVQGDYLWIDALCIDQDDLHEYACLSSWISILIGLIAAHQT